MHFKIKYDGLVNTFIIPLFLLDRILATGWEFLSITVNNRERCKLKQTQCNDHDKKPFAVMNYFLFGQILV